MNKAETLLVIVESYLSRRNHNILVLNYETLSKKFYSVVVENAKEVGNRNVMGEMFIRFSIFSI